MSSWAGWQVEIKLSLPCVRNQSIERGTGEVEKDSERKDGVIVYGGLKLAIPRTNWDRGSINGDVDVGS